ncbi:hypothetical protein BDW71DRAFT_189916 [Aspergillus fruticulosus]
MPFQKQVQQAVRTCCALVAKMVAATHCNMCPMLGQERSALSRVIPTVPVTLLKSKCDAWDTAISSFPIVLYVDPTVYS